MSNDASPDPSPGAPAAAAGPTAGAPASSATDSPAGRPTVWLVIAAILAIGGGAWMWTMTAPRVCILIYPAPPGCATQVPNWLPFIGVGLVIALFIGAVIAFFVAKQPARIIIGLAVAMAVVTLITALIMLLAGLGVFDAYQPPVDG